MSPRDRQPQIAVNGFPDVRSEKRGATSVWLDRRLEGDPITRWIADPDVLLIMPECEIIKDQKKIKVARIQLEIQGKRKGVYLKRYNSFSWRYRLGSLFRPSGGVRSLRGAAILAGARIATARPVGAMESRSWGMLDRSFFLTEEIGGGCTIDAYWRDKLCGADGTEGLRARRSFLQQLAVLFRSLHDQHIYHNDLKDANILVAPGQRDGSASFYLLDLEGIRRYRTLSRRRRLKNLLQLNRTFGRYLRATEKLTFLKFYLGPLFSDRRERRHWVRKVLDPKRRFSIIQLA